MADPTTSSDEGFIHALLFLCQGLVAALIGLGVYIVNIYRRKVDRLEQNSYITRDELDNKFIIMQEDRLRMHEEFMTNMRELRTTITGTQSETARDIRALNTRIDMSLKRSGR